MQNRIQCKQIKIYFTTKQQQQQQQQEFTREKKILSVLQTIFGNQRILKREANRKVITTTIKLMWILL